MLGAALLCPDDGAPAGEPGRLPGRFGLALCFVDFWRCCCTTEGPVEAGGVEVGAVACGLVVVVGCVEVGVGVEVVDGCSSIVSLREPEPDPVPDFDPVSELEEEPEEGSLIATGTELASAEPVLPPSSQLAQSAPLASSTSGERRARSRARVRLISGMSRAQSCCGPCDCRGFGVWEAPNVPPRHRHSYRQRSAKQ